MCRLEMKDSFELQKDWRRIFHWRNCILAVCIGSDFVVMSLTLMSLPVSCLIWMLKFISHFCHAHWIVCCLHMTLQEILSQKRLNTELRLFSKEIETCDHNRVVMHAIGFRKRIELVLWRQIHQARVGSVKKKKRWKVLISASIRRIDRMYVGEIAIRNLQGGECRQSRTDSHEACSDTVSQITCIIKSQASRGPFHAWCSNFCRTVFGLHLFVSRSDLKDTVNQIQDVYIRNCTHISIQICILHVIWTYTRVWLWRRFARMGLNSRLTD